MKQKNNKENEFMFCQEKIIKKLQISHSRTRTHTHTPTHTHALSLDNFKGQN